MSIVRFDPWREFDALLSGRPVRRVAERWVPSATVSEAADAYRIDLELPSVARDEVEVSVKDRVLTISGERKDPASDGWKVLRSERRVGAFSRSFRLPKNAREDAIEASAADGVLSVTIRKVEEAVPRRIEIAAA